MSAAPATRNPFPGLRPFTQEEDYLFFGREEQTIELLQRLGSNRFVAVVGTSGSGKSSLVRCGLLSELLGGRMLEAGASWEIAVTHPGGNPLALLTDALLEADLYDRDGRTRPRKSARHLEPQSLRPGRSGQAGRPRRRHQLPAGRRSVRGDLPLPRGRPDGSRKRPTSSSACCWKPRRRRKCRSTSC